MILRFEHVTQYVFTGPVFLEPHTIRLLPRCDPHQRVLAFDIAVSPEPAGISHCIDPEGAGAAETWFSGVHDALTVHTRGMVETLLHNPFDFLTRSGLPVRLLDTERAALAPCLAAFPTSEAEGPVREMALEAAGTAGGDVMAALGRINSLLHAGIALETRRDPGLLGPDEVLRRGRGACRDMAVAFISVCRELGVPARFVSGYQYCGLECRDQELHAWAEAYVPGGGWRGFDPTQGLVCADRHVALAASAFPAAAAPVSGSFRGTGVTSTLSHTVRIEEVSRA